jgi:hypothetical protein
LMGAMPMQQQQQQSAAQRGVDGEDDGAGAAEGGARDLCESTRLPISSPFRAKEERNEQASDDNAPDDPRLPRTEEGW